MSGRQSKRGFILVSVLWLGAFLIVLVASLMQQSRVALSVTRAGVEEAVADGLLTAAVETIGIRYSSATKIPGDGRSLPLSFADGTVRVSLQDMNGLVDLNRAESELIIALAVAGRDERSARAILERRDEPGQPLEAPWRAREELADQNGIAAGVTAFADSYATVFSASGMINPLMAPQAVLMLLPGADAEFGAGGPGNSTGSGRRSWADPGPSSRQQPPPRSNARQGVRRLLRGAGQRRFDQDAPGDDPV